jgi:hypothetical protein
LGLAVGLALWAKYFAIALALPLALFLLLDRAARKALATPGPWIALAIALVVVAPHLLWLLRNDFLPFAYAAARAAPARSLADHLLHPAAFAVGQAAYLLPALLIAGALFLPSLPRFAPSPTLPRLRGREGKGGVDARDEHAPDGAPSADDLDRRIVSLLAFGPFATTLVLSAFSGRGTVAMWGYPLWLFLGLWIVLQAGGGALPARLPRVTAVWAAVFAAFVAAFIINYSVLPGIDGRYRAVLYPGDRLADELQRRFRAATGRPLVYVIGSMWDGGNVAHYAPGRPRVLIDGNPRRAPWIDLGDLRSRGAVVLWTSGDPNVIPIGLRGIAGDAQTQPPFTLPFRRGDAVLTVGWAILRPEPAFASLTPLP